MSLPTSPRASSTTPGSSAASQPSGIALAPKRTSERIALAVVEIAVDEDRVELVVGAQNGLGGGRRETDPHLVPAQELDEHRLGEDPLVLDEERSY